MLFQLSDYSGVKYLGLLFRTSGQRLGSTTFEKVLMNQNIRLVLDVLDLDIKYCELDIGCGDLKNVYSRNGNHGS